MPPVDTFDSDFHLTAVLAGLYVYPIKSCAGIALDSSELDETGLAWDRAWMVVTPTGDFVTQRTLPRMALVRPQLRRYDMVLRAPGMLALHLPLESAESPREVRVWRDTVQAWDMGDLAAQWLSDFLGQPLRLVRADPERPRMASTDWTGGLAAPYLFADGYPLLVASQASLDGLNQRLRRAGHAPVGMDRFRPNIVLSGLDAHDEDRLEMLHIGPPENEVRLQPVKPCVRCPVPNIDPATALSDPAVGDTLQTYRADARLGGGVTFGMNAILRAGAGQVLRVGQPVSADYRFD